MLMLMKPKRLLIIALLLLTLNARFVPEQPVLPVSSLKTGMNGYTLTVLKGTEPSKIPVKILSIVPQTPGRNVSDLILIRLMGGVKLAQGMSGSPVYVNGKLIGAIRSGWQDSDQTLALVTPIDSMCSLEDSQSTSSYPKPLALTAVSVSGLNADTQALAELSRKLGVKIIQGSGSANHSVGLTADGKSLKPGDSIAALLAWGDVELSAVGTVTATAKGGKFLAFGHEFLKRGETAYPSSGVYVHEIINISSFPFKFTSTTGINGTVTQDRDAGIQGRFGYYAPSVSCGFVLRDIDNNRESAYKFRTVADEFLADELIEGICKSLAEESWGRKGQGTMSVTLRIDGKNVPNGWTRKDIFFSDSDIISEAFKQTKEIMSAYLTQPFDDAFPSGFTVTAEVSQNPRVLMIEDIETVSEAKPDEEIEIAVTLRGWRTEPFTRTFKMKIPDDASGVVELIVRGGGTQSLSQAGIEGGWKSVDSLERMLTEFRAADSNNQLILELNADRTGNLIREIQRAKNKTVKTSGKSSTSTSKSARKSSRPAKTPPRDSDLLPEEEEYLSETKERRISEGTLRIYSADYCVEGLMRRIIHVEK